VTEVTATASADDFGPRHAETVVGASLDAVVVDGVPETRPSRPGLVLRLRVEQFGAAPGTGVRAVRFLVEVLAASARFRSLLSEDLVLLVAQAFAPLRLGVGKVVGPRVVRHGLP
jgi:hypothetical protein